MNPAVPSPLHCPRMILQCNSDSVSFRFEVLLLTVKSGNFPTDNELFYELLASMLPDSGFSLCQGLPLEMDTVLPYETKNLRKWGAPFNRLDHKNCLMWLTALTGGVRCQQCTTLLYYMKKEGKKRQAITPEQKAARASSGSHFPYMYLSPFSKKQRRTSTLRERKSLQHKVSSCTQSVT